MNAASALKTFLNALPDGAPLGVAVSGGSDSMALLHLLVQAGCAPHVATVHHHLRDEAGSEADFVADYCANHGLHHTVLHWNWDDQGNLQDQARRGRYKLLSDWAKGQRLCDVALGHTADDNIETFLMGLSRGAGIDGLSGMRPTFEHAGVTFRRPFLRTRRDELRAVLIAKGLSWRDDPSNDNPDYQRVQMRQGFAALEALGLTAEMLTKTVSNLQATRRDIETTLAQDVQQHVTLDHGDICIALDWLEDTTPEHRRRVLNAALRYVSSLDYTPRAGKLAQIMQNLRHPGTLHGCILSSQDTTLRITRELSAVVGTTVTSRTVWDQRWRCDGPHTDHTLLRALGEPGIAACPDGWRGLGLPRASVLASPSVWNGDVLISAPLAGWANGWHINLCAKPPTLFASILSH